MRSTDWRHLAGAVLTAVLCAGLFGVGAQARQSKKQPPNAGRVWRVEDDVYVQERHITAPINVMANTVVKTTGGGQAKLEIKLANTFCTTASDLRLVVRPRWKVVLQLLSGEIACKIEIAGRSCGKLFVGPAKVSSCNRDPLFLLIVRKGRAVVKVKRGFVIVSGHGGRAGAVLVARNRQVVVPAGHDPQAPTPATLTRKQKKALAIVQTVLAPNRDSTPPRARISSAPPKATASGSATFTFAAAERGVAFACSLDAGPFHPCSSPKSYAGLALGAHVFRVSATDTAGNTALAGFYSWTIDTRAPITTITSQQPVTTSATSATFAFTADEVGVRFDCQLDGAGFAPCSSPTTYSVLAVGRHSFTVRATDAAGNVGPPAAPVSWTIDTRVPVVMIQSDRPARTNATSVTFTFSADKSPVSFACQLDGGALAVCSSPKTYSDLPGGVHTFLVQATDSARNVGATTYTWDIDIIPPSTRIKNGPPMTTTATSATFTFAADEVGVRFDCQLDGAGFAPCASPTSYSGLALGPHTFDVKATDTAGNIGLATTYMWTITQVP